jgi:inner membrane protein
VPHYNAPMASLFTHAVVAASLGQAAPKGLRKSAKFWGMAIFCACLPDIDVIGFGFGIRYGAPWGHRGMTHSLFFAAVVAAFMVARFTVRPDPDQEASAQANAESWGRWNLGLLLFVITASHGLLDALTNGGLGVAFFSPFDLHRYFFPFRPIVVSPIGAGHFFTQRGVEVLSSEIWWIWGPAALVAAALRGLRAWREGMECG